MRQPNQQTHQPADEPPPVSCILRPTTRQPQCQAPEKGKRRKRLWQRPEGKEKAAKQRDQAGGPGEATRAHDLPGNAVTDQREKGGEKNEGHLKREKRTREQRSKGSSNERRQRHPVQKPGMGQARRIVQIVPQVGLGQAATLGQVHRPGSIISRVHVAGTGDARSDRQPHRQRQSKQQQ